MGDSSALSRSQSSVSSFVPAAAAAAAAKSSTADDAASTADEDEPVPPAVDKVSQVNQVCSLKID